MQLDPPADKSIITLWLGGIEPDVSEADIRGVIYPYGQIAGFHLVRSAKCAFVEYVDREAAEGAAAQLYNALMVNGRPLSVNWAIPKPQSGDGNSSSSASAAGVMLPPPGMERAPQSAYVLPGMAAPVVSWPPQPPPLPPTDASTAATAGNKRPRAEESSAPAVAGNKPRYTPAPPLAPPPRSAGLLAGLAAYGDDDDDEEEDKAAVSSPAAVFSTQSNKHKGSAAGGVKKGGIQYPSMNPARMGATM